MKRSRPLKRRTPLRSSTTPLKRSELTSRRRIPARSERARGWLAWQQQERALVFERAWRARTGLPLAHLCEYPGCDERPSEWHHAFGRSGTVSEPWASSRLLTVASCRVHHEAAHAQRAVRAAWREQALTRLRAWLSEREVVCLVPLPAPAPPAELALHLVAAAEAGVWPPGLTDAVDGSSSTRVG
jgi:hypothetical protein